MLSELSKLTKNSTSNRSRGFQRTSKPTKNPMKWTFIILRYVLTSFRGSPEQLSHNIKITLTQNEFQNLICNTLKQCGGKDKNHGTYVI